MKFIVIYLILFFYNNFVVAVDIKIEVKVQNEIITNIDVDHEKRYLMFLNPKLRELDDTKIQEIAQNSLVAEIIKKRELKKIFNFEENIKIIDVLEKNFLIKKKIKDKSEYLRILKKEGLDYKKIRSKLQIEGLWNQLIYKKYFNNVKIDKEGFKVKIMNNFKNKEKKYEFNLSEIVFVPNAKESLEDLINKIEKSIKTIGFENSANIFSISSTAKNGGIIGWVNELQISNQIGKNLRKLKINEHSKPIQISGGYIIIKINNKREFKQEFNLEDQLDKFVSQETNRQLNSFSDIFYKKLKKNIEIYEY